MNKGTTRHPKYICDKCKNYIYYEPRKGFKNLVKYYRQQPASNPIKKDFDLCENCETRFREWLNTKEIPTTAEILSNFPQFIN